MDKWFEIVNTAKNSASHQISAETITPNGDGTYRIHPTGATPDQDSLLYIPQGSILQEKEVT